MRTAYKAFPIDFCLDFTNIMIFWVIHVYVKGPPCLLRLYLIFSRAKPGRISEMKSSWLHFGPFEKYSAIKNFLLITKIVNIVFFRPIFFSFLKSHHLVTSQIWPTAHRDNETMTLCLLEFHQTNQSPSHWGHPAVHLMPRLSWLFEAQTVSEAPIVEWIFANKDHEQGSLS
jgi:hypothetical protein